MGFSVWFTASIFISKVVSLFLGLLLLVGEIYLLIAFKKENEKCLRLYMFENILVLYLIAILAMYRIL